MLLGTELAKLALRQGLPVVICGGTGEAALVQAAEAIGAFDLTLLREQSGNEPTLVSERRPSDTTTPPEPHLSATTGAPNA